MSSSGHVMSFIDGVNAYGERHGGPVPSWVFNAMSAAGRGFEWLDVEGRATTEVERCRRVRCSTCGHVIGLVTSFLTYVKHQRKHTEPVPLTPAILRMLPIVWSGREWARLDDDPDD
jgi:hypothetical protein